MKVIFTILFLLIGFSLRCQTNKINQLTKAELDVYKTLLAEKPNEIVVIDETKVGLFGEIKNGGLKEILKGLQNDTFDSFVKINSTPPFIDDNFKADFNFQVINKVEFEKTLKPSNHYVFSRVGFSHDGKQAAVIFNQVCSALCGKGSYILLTNNDKGWEITEESISWKS